MMMMMMETKRVHLFSRNLGDKYHLTWELFDGNGCHATRFFGRLEEECAVTVTVAVNLRKAAENLFVRLRVAALVIYELAPSKCTD